MTKNDYIAEYVREKHANILRFDFTLWKIARCFKNLVNAFGGEEAPGEGGEDEVQEKADCD